MSYPFVILNITTNPIEYLAPDNTFTTDPAKAKHFATLEKGRDGKRAMHEELQFWGDQQNNYTVIPYTGSLLPAKRKSLPPADFFEVARPLTAEHIYEILNVQDFDLCFTMVDLVTGSGQMKVEVIINQFDDKVEGRALTFTFPGVISHDEEIILREFASEHWKSVKVETHGSGFAMYTALILKTGLR